jgi:hypothetical protein
MHSVEEQDNGDDESSVGEATTTVDGIEPSNDENEHVLMRRGDIEKCPVCGLGVDAEAYHCPSCSNYFCYQCRARLVPPDPQLQCVNQHCDYYGKLVCEVCDIAHEREEEPTVYAEPEDGYWPGLLLLAVLCFVPLWYFYSLQIAAVSTVGGFIIGGLLLHWSGINIFGMNQIVEHQRKSPYHCCICCGEVVKKIRGVK